MFLRPDSLRGDGHAVPRNELPLFDLPTDERRAVRRLFSVRPSEFRWLSGSPSQFRSSTQASRSFCAHCGTQLAFRDDGYPDEIDVTTCSLDQPETVPPRDHTHVSSRLPWISLSDALPQFSQARSGA
jgi:hypothetical protein